MKKVDATIASSVYNRSVYTCLAFVPDTCIPFFAFWG